MFYHKKELFFILSAILIFALLVFAAVPTHNTPVLNATNINNNTLQNLTCYNQSTADTDGGKVVNIFTWYRNGTPVQTLNMPFEGESNNSFAKDYSEYGNNMSSVVSDPFWNITGGYNGNGAFDFDNNDAFLISDSASLSLIDNFTATGWARRDSDNGYDGFFGKVKSVAGTNYSGWGVGFDDVSNKFTAIVACKSVFTVLDGNSTANNNFNWHHFALRVSSRNTTFWIDGTMQSETSTTTICDSDSQYVVGRYYSDFNAHYLNGSVDEVILWNRSLSDDQIKALYRNNTNLIHKDETNIGDQWICTITPSDNLSNGASKNSSVLTIADDTPTHAAPILNATNNNNNTNKNLTCYNQTTADAQGNTVTNIFSWYINTTPIQVLNMPFEGGSDGSSTNFYAADYSGYRNNLSYIVDDPFWNSTGGYNTKGCFDFDGSDALFINTHETLKAIDNFTAMAWVKRDVDGGYDGFLGKVIQSGSNFTGWGIGFDDVLNKFSGFISCNGIYTSINASSGDLNWHHLALRVKNKNATLWVDGVMQSETTNTTLCDSGEPVVIGRYYSNFDNHYLVGKVDEVVIWNRSLSDNQILAIFQNRTDLIHSNDTIEDDQYVCSITPNDGKIDGLLKNSSSLTIIGLPDLRAAIDSINVSNTSPIENQTITITAIINNTGGVAATNLLTTIIVNNNQTNITIASLAARSSTTKIITGTTAIGPNNITLKLDTNNTVEEPAETDDNQVMIFVNTSIYQIALINVSVNLSLATSVSNTVFNVENITAFDYLLIADDAASVNFGSLQSIGIKINGLTRASTDFADIDSVLLLGNATDNIKQTYGNGTETPLQLTNVTLYGSDLQNVSFINATNTSSPSFISGILWDTSDDSSANSEFDTTDKEDLVFITKYNRATSTEYGTFDAVLKYPASLRKYKDSDYLVNIYLVNKDL